MPTAYPPTCFLLLAPLAILPWWLAHALWLIVNLVGYGSLMLSLAAFMRLGGSNSCIYAFLFLSLALAPFHTGLGAGSIVIVAVALSAVAFVAGELKREICAGVLLSVAIGLKPQIGLPFLVYFFLRRRWRPSVIAVGAVGILATLAILRLAVAGTPWINNYIYDNTVLFSRGSLGDFTEADPMRFSLINLQVLLYAVLRDRAIANVLALTVALIMGIAWIVFLRPRGGNTDNLLAVSTIVVISLLPVYHRLYDASLLILPLSWSLASLSSGKTKLLAKMTLCLVLVFLVPGATVLEYLEHTNHAVAALSGTWWWNVIVMPHQVWALFALGLVLLGAMRVTNEVNGRNLKPRHWSKFATTFHIPNSQLFR
jgi:alpha-1,2-mannosyltransferase